MKIPGITCQMGPCGDKPADRLIRSRSPRSFSMPCMLLSRRTMAVQNGRRPGAYPRVTCPGQEPGSSSVSFKYRRVASLFPPFEACPLHRHFRFPGSFVAYRSKRVDTTFNISFFQALRSNSNIHSRLAPFLLSIFGVSDLPKLHTLVTQTPWQAN